MTTALLVARRPLVGSRKKTARSALSFTYLLFALAGSPKFNKSFVSTIGAV